MLEHLNFTSVAWIFAIAVILIVLYWWLSNTAVNQPQPPVPDSDYLPMIADIQKYPESLWFRDDPETFEEWLKCSEYRYIVYKSNGAVVFDTKSLGCNPGTRDSASRLRHSFEYIRTQALNQGEATRREGCITVLNMARLMKSGNYYRTVHVSQRAVQEGY